MTTQTIRTDRTEPPMPAAAPESAVNANNHTAERTGLSLGTLFSELAEQLTTLMRREVELARVETQETVSTMTRSAVSMIAGAVIAYAGLIILLLAATYGLANVIPLWMSAVIVGGITIVLGAIVYFAGRKALDNATIVPEKTVETVQDDLRMVREKIK